MTNESDFIEEKHINFTNLHFKFLLQIAMTKYIKKGGTFKDFATELGYEKLRPDIWKILSLLKDKEILEVCGIERGFTLHRLNKKKMEQFLMTLDIMGIIENYYTTYRITI